MGLGHGRGHRTRSAECFLGEGDAGRVLADEQVQLPEQKFGRNRDLRADQAPERCQRFDDGWGGVGDLQLVRQDRHEPERPEGVGGLERGRRLGEPAGRAAPRRAAVADEEVAEGDAGLHERGGHAVEDRKELGLQLGESGVGVAGEDHRGTADSEFQAEPLVGVEETVGQLRCRLDGLEGTGAISLGQQQ